MVSVIRPSLASSSSPPSSSPSPVVLSINEGSSPNIWIKLWVDIYIALTSWSISSAACQLDESAAKGGRNCPTLPAEAVEEGLYEQTVLASALWVCPFPLAPPSAHQPPHSPRCIRIVRETIRSMPRQWPTSIPIRVIRGTGGGIGDRWRICAAVPLIRRPRGNV